MDFLFRFYKDDRKIFRNVRVVFSSRKEYEFYFFYIVIGNFLDVLDNN